MITKEEFQSAQVGDSFVDAKGCEWRVMEREGSHLHVLVEHDQDELMWNDGQILNEEWAVVLELNHTDARFKKKAA